MARLKPADRGVLALAYWEDLKPTEIGEVLGVSTNAAPPFACIGPAGGSPQR